MVQQFDQCLETYSSQESADQAIKSSYDSEQLDDDSFHLPIASKGFKTVHLVYGAKKCAITIKPQQPKSITPLDLLNSNLSCIVGGSTKSERRLNQVTGPSQAPKIFSGLLQLIFSPHSNLHPVLYDSDRQVCFNDLKDGHIYAVYFEPSTIPLESSYIQTLQKFPAFFEVSSFSSDESSDSAVAADVDLKLEWVRECLKKLGKSCAETLEQCESKIQALLHEVSEHIDSCLARTTTPQPQARKNTTLLSTESKPATTLLKSLVFTSAYTDKRPASSFEALVDNRNDLESTPYQDKRNCLQLQSDLDESISVRPTVKTTPQRKIVKPSKLS